MILLPDVLNTRQFTWVWVVKINAIWIGRAKVCTLEEDDVFIISTCSIKYHSMVMYISSAVNYFRSMCKSNDSLCIVIYILYKDLEYYIPEDSCVNLEKSVAFQKCSGYQPLSLLLCWEVSFQSTWLLDYSKVKQLPEASSPIWLISFQMWNSSLDCIGKWRDAHLKYDWVAQWFPVTYERSHFLILFLHHALLSLLWLHLWIHAQDHNLKNIGLSVWYTFINNLKSSWDLSSILTSV